MWSYIKENAKAFRIGGIGSFGVWAGKLLTPTGVWFDVGQIFWRTLAAGCAAIATGLLSAIVADFYKHHIQKRIFKSKDNERQDDKRA